MDIYVKMTFYY